METIKKLIIAMALATSLIPLAPAYAMSEGVSGEDEKTDEAAAINRFKQQLDLAIVSGDEAQVTLLLSQKYAHLLEGDGRALRLAIDYACDAVGSKADNMDRVKRLLIFAGADENCAYMRSSGSIWWHVFNEVHAEALLYRERRAGQNGIAKAAKERDRVLGEIGLIETVIPKIVSNACQMPSELARIVGDYLLPIGDGVINRFVDRHAVDQSAVALLARKLAMNEMLFADQPKEVCAQRAVILSECAKVQKSDNVCSKISRVMSSVFLHRRVRKVSSNEKKLS